MSDQQPSSPPASWDEKLFASALEETLEALGLSLPPETTRQMTVFAGLLFHANQTLNLTRITQERDMALKHFGDSLTLLKALPSQANNLVDVGSGGGFPGIALAISRPDIHVTLVEATQRKVAFLNRVIDKIGLEQCRAVAGRAEELARRREHRQCYDVAVWRGLGTLAESSELCLPLVKPGGVGIAMKGPKLDEELSGARALIGQLGGRVERTVPAGLPGGLDHRLLIIAKARPTPPVYPRAWPRIRKA